MDENKPTTPGQALPPEQVDAISGGEGDCSVTVTVGGVTVSGTSVGDALIQVYDGAVDATSHVIETLANTTR